MLMLQHGGTKRRNPCCAHSLTCCLVVAMLSVSVAIASSTMFNKVSHFTYLLGLLTQIFALFKQTKALCLLSHLPPLATISLTPFSSNHRVHSKAQVRCDVFDPSLCVLPVLTQSLRSCVAFDHPANCCSFLFKAQAIPSIPSAAPQTNTIGSTAHKLVGPRICSANTHYGLRY